MEDLSTIAEKLSEAIRNRKTVLILGECTIAFDGRTSTYLGPGERVMIIKEDGAVIIHRPRGYRPVNYQPSTDVIETWYRPDSGLTVIFARRNPREILKVNFTRVKVFYADALVDNGELVVYADEEAVKKVLVNNPHIIEPGLKILEAEKKLPGGIVADLYGVDSTGRDVVIEVKRVVATKEAVIQLYSYTVSFTRLTNRRPRGILVAPDFTPSALESLARLGLEHRSIDLKKIRELLAREKSNLWKKESQANGKGKGHGLGDS